MKSWAVDDTGRLKKIIERLSSEDGEYICRIIQRDPIQGIYTKLSLIYVLLLGVFLLWPFDFIFRVKNDVRWIENSKGVEFLGTGQAVSNSAHQELFDRLVKGSGLTLEVWLQTEDLNQAGPARIISYTKNKESCNFMLGQAWDKLIVRLLTTKTSSSGMSPNLVIPDIFTSRSLKHIIIIYDFSEQRVYINGEQTVRSNVLKGDFSTWDPFCRLSIGNEVTGDMPWKGKIYYVAIFDRALAEPEIRQNYLSGLGSKIDTFPAVLSKKESAQHNGFTTKDPVARYFFDEVKNGVIHNSGMDSNSLDLFIPKYIMYNKEPFFDFLIGSLQIKPGVSDLVINILIFIPLGMFIHGMLRTRYGLTMKVSLATLLVGTLFTLGVESLQHFSMTRNSSLIDVFTNMTGVAMGITIASIYALFLNRQAERLRMLVCDGKE